jgi:spermidine/putrescine transport system substrate-binding protein
MTDYSDQSDLDPILLRGLTQRRLSRGEMLRVTGAGFGALSLASFLAACGSGNSSASGSTSNSPAKVGSAAWWNQQKAGSQVRFANWPLYIDVEQQGGHSVHRSLQDFTKQTGIKVSYSEVIQAYDSFFGKIRPSLAAGQGTGYDLIVMGYPKWLPLMIHLGYLIALDHAKLPNFTADASSFAKNPFYDPGNTYSIPWQSGITGIGYNPKLTGREITSYWDLMDPKFKGKVGMFADTEDLPNMALLGIGVEPTKSTPKDWQKAANVLKKQKQEGIVRKYYDQSYIDALTKGDTWLSMAWSGDIYQANLSGAPNLKFVVPKEGGLLWSDCMCVPLHSGNPLGALKLMDYVYKPAVAAMITEYVHYIAPVPASQAIIKQDAARATDPKTKAKLLNTATSPIVFPSNAELHRLHFYRNLNAKETQAWDSLFQPIYQS